METLLKDLRLAVRMLRKNPGFCAMLCGLVPALNAARTDVNTNIKDEGRTASAGKSQSRLRKLMVTGEIALALVLLVGTGLLIRGIAVIESQNLGFQPSICLRLE